MGHQPKLSLFAASRAAAAKIMNQKEETILRYETSDDARTRSYLKTSGLSDAEIDTLRDNYHLYARARHVLGIR